MENRVKITDEGIVVESNSGIIRADGAKEVTLDGDFSIDSESVGRLLATTHGGYAVNFFPPHYRNSYTRWYTSDADLLELTTLQREEIAKAKQKQAEAEKRTAEADELIKATNVFVKAVKNRYKWGIALMITATLLNLISLIIF